MDRKLIDYKQILYVIEFLNDCVGSWQLPHVKRNTLPSLNDLGVIPFDNAIPKKFQTPKRLSTSLLMIINLNLSTNTLKDI